MNGSIRGGLTMRYEVAAAIVAVVALSGPPLAQTREPSMREVLRNAADYVAGFQKQLSGLVAEETYVQEVDRPKLWVVAPEDATRRVLRSDLLLVKPAKSDRYVEFRDVFEVDAASVRNRDERLTGLVGAGSFDQMRDIITESARYNIGHITRNINTPVLALQFLDAAFQSHFRFKRATKERQTVNPKGATPAPHATPDAAVFRVATEMWTVEYEERERPTIIRTPRGQNLPARGRFWINPNTGAVLMSELVIKGEGLNATITVSYQSEPLVGFLVPVAMNESYEGNGERVVGSATYGQFRQLTK
jgi:hypothetical protein